MSTMHLLIDSKSLLDIILKGSNTSKKRIMLGFHAALQAYRLHEISNIGFVRTNHNLADGLTKANMQGALYKLMATGKLEVEAEQWILRDAA